MSKATEMTPEQKAQVEKLMNDPTALSSAFSFFKETQVAAFRARCQAWVIELTIWRILSVLVGIVAGLTLIVPEWRVWSVPALVSWGIFVLCGAYVFFSLPKS